MSYAGQRINTRALLLATILLANLSPAILAALVGTSFPYQGELLA